MSTAELSVSAVLDRYQVATHLLRGMTEPAGEHYWVPKANTVFKS
jgi:hypothetical protein